MLEKQKNRERKAPLVTEGHPCQKHKTTVKKTELTNKSITLLTLGSLNTGEEIITLTQKECLKEKSYESF